MNFLSEESFPQFHHVTGLSTNMIKKTLNSILKYFKCTSNSKLYNKYLLKKTFITKFKSFQLYQNYKKDIKSRKN